MVQARDHESCESWGAAGTFLTSDAPCIVVAIRTLLPMLAAVTLAGFAAPAAGLTADAEVLAFYDPTLGKYCVEVFVATQAAHSWRIQGTVRGVTHASEFDTAGPGWAFDGCAVPCSVGDDIAVRLYQWRFDDWQLSVEHTFPCVAA